MTEWVIDLAGPDSAPVVVANVEAAFDRAWREAHDFPTLYGREASGRWTYAVARDAPAAFAKVAWGISLRPLRDAPVPNEAGLTRTFDAIAGRARGLGLAAAAREPLVAAAARARKLEQIVAQCGHMTEIRLVAPTGAPFEGRAVWDVMMSIGLQWGDMDCFHWPNDSEHGDDALFSVENLSEPGYFLPEEIAAGELRSIGLRFLFEVPRSRAPKQVFDAMLRAAEYARTRLGGGLARLDGGCDPNQLVTHAAAWVEG